VLTPNLAIQSSGSPRPWRRCDCRPTPGITAIGTFALTFDWVLLAGGQDVFAHQFDLSTGQCGRS
jgi:hypothetical protein